MSDGVDTNIIYDIQHVHLCYIQDKKVYEKKKINK